MPKSLKFRVRGTSLLLALLGGVTWIPEASAQNAELTGNDLADAVTAVQSYVPRDQFDTAPDGPAWSGRRFSFTVAPIGRVDGARTDCAGMPEWAYVNGTLDVDLWGGHMGLSSFPEQSRLAGSRRPKADMFADPTIYSVSCVRSPIEKYQASNAFGAQLIVERWTETAIGVVDPSRFDEKFKRYWEKSMDGPTARELSRNLKVRVSGVLSAWPDGRSIACGSSRVEPDLKLPIEVTTKACGFYGHIEQVEFIDDRSGEILYSIKRTQR